MATLGLDLQENKMKKYNKYNQQIANLEQKINDHIETSEDLFGQFQDQAGHI